MKTIKLGDAKTVMSNPTSHHNYFAWPTVARLKNGRLALVASGFRLRHVCMFGKAVISYSENEGESFTLPAPVIDRVLDDRDAGITAFGESGVIVTSFANDPEFQLKYAENDPYDEGYIKSLTKEELESGFGPSFRISQDNGITFGPILESPITSPHGPLALSDGTLLWVGTTTKNGGNTPETQRIEAHRINPDGTMEKLGEIEGAEYNGEALLSAEPHAIELDDGRILAHIRIFNRIHDERNILTIYQSESSDGGRSWSKPERLLDKRGGAPAHLIKHSSGALISTYGRRIPPYGIRAMISFDNGKTWNIDNEIYSVTEDYPFAADLGYPASVELKDGSIMTVFYSRQSDASSIILAQKWKFEK